MKLDSLGYFKEGYPTDNASEEFTESAHFDSSLEEIKKDCLGMFLISDLQ